MEPLIGLSTNMREVQNLIARAAASSATVLLRGESGTGKEVVARTIHEQSPRSDSAFVKLHCAAFPDALLESELFGYEKGAFTGALSRKPGRIELAHQGTLFLDEIGDITPATQVKLLRLLQDREIERLGGVETIRVDVRIIAATHRDLRQMIDDGTFREDLFYRLCVIPVWIPPLRERVDDIELLVEHFCMRYSPQGTVSPVRMAAEAMALLRKQTWPGNVRQLQNFIERVIVLSDGPAIETKDVQREFERTSEFGAEGTTSEEGDITLDDRRRRAERLALLSALRQAQNNRTLAAKLLGVSRRTLYAKLERHRLS